MKVAYHLTIPPSPWAKCDALVQEVAMLRDHFGGVITHLYPARQPGTRIPRSLWGMLQWPKLRQIERRVSIHHFYNPDPYPFPILSLLRKPIIYTISAGVQEADQHHAQRLAQQVHTLIVPTEAEREQLRLWGIENVAVVRPAIDITPFSTMPRPTAHFPTLLMGSAPWTLAQFRTKGVDALLDMAQRWPELRLIFLWRGILYEEMLQRVETAGLEERVEVINHQVDVKTILRRVHAATILATESDVIKAYPHSLLEALAAGRPVIVWEGIPIAQEIQASAAGILVNSLQAETLIAAFQTLLDDYESYARHAQELGATFSQTQFLAQHAELYRAAGETDE